CSWLARDRGWSVALAIPIPNIRGGFLGGFHVDRHRCDGKQTKKADDADDAETAGYGFALTMALATSLFSLLKLPREALASRDLMWVRKEKTGRISRTPSAFPNEEEPMRPDTTRPGESSTPRVIVPTLYVAFYLGGSTWKLAATPGPGQPPRLRTVPARSLTRTLDELAR